VLRPNLSRLHYQALEVGTPQAPSRASRAPRVTPPFQEPARRGGPALLLDRSGEQLRASLGPDPVLLAAQHHLDGCVRDLRHAVALGEDGIGAGRRQALLHRCVRVAAHDHDGADGGGAAAEEAWEQVARGGIDLVVSDIQMPRLDGLGLTRRIKADPDRRGLPVILVTSLGAEEDRRAGLLAGADGYLVKKDVESGKLLELVRMLLPQKRG
jgi:CheY-like chemotaxis protein